MTKLHLSGDGGVVALSRSADADALLIFQVDAPSLLM